MMRQLRPERVLRSGPGPVSHTQGLRATAARIAAAEALPQEESRRGRRFLRLYLALVVLALGAFVLLAVLARDVGVLLRIDVPVTEAIQAVHLPVYGWVLTHTSDLGWVPLNVLAYGAVGLALLAVRLPLEAVLAVVPSVMAGLVGGAIKLVVERTRPSGILVHVVGRLHDYSFPSGHVIQYTTLFGFAFYVLLVAWRAGWVRCALLVVLALLVMLVGPSRVYLGQHWPSDVLGAYLFAGLWLAGTIELHLFVQRRLAARRQPQWQHGRAQVP